MVTIYDYKVYCEYYQLPKSLTSKVGIQNTK